MTGLRRCRQLPSSGSTDRPDRRARVLDPCVQPLSGVFAPAAIPPAVARDPVEVPTAASHAAPTTDPAVKLAVPGRRRGGFTELDEAGQALDVLVNNTGGHGRLQTDRAPEHGPGHPCHHHESARADVPVPGDLSADGGARQRAHRQHPVHRLPAHLDGAAPYAAGKLGLRAFRPTLFQEAQRDCLDIDVIGIIASGMEAPFILERFHDADTSSSGTWRSSPTPCCTRCRCPRPARWTKSSSSRATSRPDRSSRTRSTSPANLFVQSFDPAAEQRSDR